MKLFKKNQSNKRNDENYNKILKDADLEPYSYTPPITEEKSEKDSGIEARYVNTQQSFTILTGSDDASNTIKEQKSHFNEIQKREVNNKNTSYVVRESQLYSGDDISSIQGDIGAGYDDLDSASDNYTSVSSNTKSSTQYTRTTRDEMSETTSNYQNSSENNYTNLQTQSIYATPIFSGFLYKLGRNKRWQWRMFCFDGMSLACLSSKCKPKYVIPLDKVESIKLLHRNAPEYKPNTFVITVEKNDCRGKMDDGFFPYSEGSVSDDPLIPKRTFSMGYYSYLLRAKTSVDLERWMFVLLTMYRVLKREQMMINPSFTISDSPPQGYSFINRSYSQNSNSFRSRSDSSYRGRKNSYDDYSDNSNSNDDEYSNSSNSNTSTSNEINPKSSDSLKKIKIPSLNFAPPLATMITSQYKDKLSSPDNNSSGSKRTSLKSGSNGKDSKVDIISSQRYRDPNYNPGNYGSSESRRNKSGKQDKDNDITVRAVNSLDTNTKLSSSKLSQNNGNNIRIHSRKESLNSSSSSSLPSSKNHLTKPSRTSSRAGRESVIVSSIMEDFIFNDFDKSVEIDDSLKEYAVQSLRLFTLAEQKAVVENVQQAWHLGREDDGEMLDILVQELRKTPVKVDNVRESIVSQKAEIEIMEDDSEIQDSSDNTFVSFAVNVDQNSSGSDDDNSSKSSRRIRFHKRNESMNAMNKSGSKSDKSYSDKRSTLSSSNSSFVQKAWRNSIASLLNLDSELNVSLGLSNFYPSLTRMSGEIRNSGGSSHSSHSDKSNYSSEYNKLLGRDENNSITPRMVNNTRLAGMNTIRRNQGNALYLGDIAEESDSDSDSDDDDRPIRKDSMNAFKTQKNRMSYIPKGRPFSYYLEKTHRN